MAKSKLLADLKELEMYVQSCNKIDILNATKKHYRYIKGIANSIWRKDSSCEEKGFSKWKPQNTTEVLFYKKPRNASTSALSKPSFLEVENCLIELKKKEAMVCGNCLKENDINHSNQVIQWIQCDTCSMWLHFLCTIPKLTFLPQYLCTNS